jgi:hypothetical protein
MMMVEQRLNALSLPFEKLELGEVTMQEPPTDAQFNLLKEDLGLLGFELLDDRKASVISQVKSCIISYIHSDDDGVLNKKLSAR